MYVYRYFQQFFSYTTTTRLVGRREDSGYVANRPVSPQPKSVPLQLDSYPEAPRAKGLIRIYACCV